MGIQMFNFITSFLLSATLLVSTQFLMPCLIHSSDLDHLICAEIKNDAFYEAILRLVRNESIKTILEIGSSSGEGSTEAFASAIKHNPMHPTLFCMELSNVRFKTLQEYYLGNPQVICYNVSSVPVEAFPSEEMVISFMKTNHSSLNYYGTTEVLRWLRQDIDYIKNSNAPQNGIDLIKSHHNIEHFDVVLIDGSEFTGEAELERVYGAKFLLLDDTTVFKNYNNYIRLRKDPNYRLIEENPYLRNGYAIFKRV
jgi:hypothetical protein